jgi:hypothetical protein
MNGPAKAFKDSVLATTADHGSVKSKLKLGYLGHFHLGGSSEIEEEKMS